MKRLELKSLIREIIINEMESTTEIGDRFNYDGLTWKVIKTGITSSKAEVQTLSHKGKTKEFDNKTINKNKIK